MLLEEAYDQCRDPNARLNLNAVNRSHFTALDIAVMNECEPIIHMMEARGMRRPQCKDTVPAEFLCCLCGRLLYHPATWPCGHAACLYCMTLAVVQPEHGGQPPCPKRCGWERVPGQAFPHMLVSGFP